jgi:hypothetical protein
LKTSTLVQILKSFSKDELGKFSEFIASPYFNKAAYIRNFFERIRVFYPAFENYEENKKTIFKSIYPEREYNDATIRKLNSELLKLAEEFIIVNSLKEKEFIKSNLLLEELDVRKIDNLYMKILSASYSSLEKEGFKNERYYKELLVLNETEFIFHSMRDRNKGFPVHYESLANLEKFYLIQKLKKIVVIMSEDRNAIAQKITPKEKKEIDNFIKLVQSHKFFDLPIIRILYNILMNNIKGDREYFDNLKNLVQDYKATMSDEELMWIYFAMLNYCVIQGNTGKKEFVKEELELYRHIIKAGFLIYNNTIETIFFKNIISCVAEAGDLKFAEEFKEENIQYVFAKDKTDITLYCDAIIAYAKKQYVTALELLARTNFTNINLKFGLRCLTMKILYENAMYEQAFLSIDSFQQNLKREKTLPEEFIILYTAFLGFYKKLLKLKLSPNKLENSLLYNSVKKTETIAKTWLLEQSKALP